MGIRLSSSHRSSRQKGLPFKNDLSKKEGPDVPSDFVKPFTNMASPPDKRETRHNVYLFLNSDSLRFPYVGYLYL
jgi:hypothetical protein